MTEGSLMTTPFPRTYTSVFAVPRSIAMSLLKSKFLENRDISLCEHLCARFLRYLPACAIHHLKFSRGDRVLPDDDARRDTEQVALRELLSRAKVAVVVQHFHTFLNEVVIQRVRHLGDVVAGLPERYEMHRKRRHALGPHKPLLVGKHLHN